MLDRPPPHVVPPLGIFAEAGRELHSSEWQTVVGKAQERVQLLLKVRSVISVVAPGSIGKSNLKTKLIRVESAN